MASAGARARLAVETYVDPEWAADRADAEAVQTYAGRRADQLLGLLEDVESWRVLHRHALAEARQHERGTEARAVLDRLAQVAADVAELAERTGNDD